jgi:site-specific DNA-methyltransferase (adenine-specific)
LAANQLGLTEAPVHVAENLTPAQIRPYRLLDNRSHEETRWDEELLGLELLDLKAVEFDLSLTGFDMDEIDDLLAGAGIDGFTDPDSVPETPETPVSSPGDLWILGQHRLLCGDATSGVDVGRLMNGELADLVFSDPPYNVSYEGYTEDRLKIAGDRMTAKQFESFLEMALASLRLIVRPESSLYICHASFWQRQFEEALENAGFTVRCQIIWAKNTFAWGFGRYKFQHEPIFYCHVTGEGDSWYGNKSQSTLWEENKPSANRLHPTMKPVELIERALVQQSQRQPCGRFVRWFRVNPDRLRTDWTTGSFDGD